MNNFPDYLHPAETAIIDAVIQSALSRGFSISVFDGEEWALKRSMDRSMIQKQTAATDMTKYLMRDEEGAYRGSFWFVHGNGADVIAHCTDNEICEGIFKEVENLCDWDRFSCSTS